MIPGGAICQILHFGLKLLATMGVSDTDVQFAMRLLLIGFEALGHNWADFTPAAVVTRNVLFGTEPVRGLVASFVRGAHVCITNCCCKFDWKVIMEALFNCSFYLRRRVDAYGQWSS
jgi:hypothetical protein